MTSAAATVVESAAAEKPGRSPLHIPSLDGIRAVSFLIVFVAHAGLDIVPGGFGVTVFFFLSGFLIATLLRAELERHGRISLKNFYLRRALRILPPFYLVLAAAVLASLVGLLPGDIRALPVLAQMLHIANYWQILFTAEGQPSGTGVYWSLAVEEHFYLLFPVLYWVLFRTIASKRGHAIALLSVCLAVLCWRLYLVYVLYAPTDHLYMATDSRFDSILFGCILASYHNPAVDEPGRAGSLWKWVLLPIGVAVLLFSFVYRDPGFRDSLRYTLQGLALFPIFVVAIREPDWGPFRLLNLRWVKLAGALSYSLYLLHQVVLLGVEHRTQLSPVSAGLLALSISGFAAYAIHRLVELPCAKLRRRLAADEAGHQPVVEQRARRVVLVETARP